MLNRRQWLHQLGLALSAFAQPKNALAVPSSNEQPKPQANNKKPALALADYEPGSMLHAQETFVERAAFAVVDVHTHITVSAKSQNGVALAAERSYLGKPDELLSVLDRENIRAMETDPHGNPVPKYRTEVRTRWTAQNLYFLFVRAAQSEAESKDFNRDVRIVELGRGRSLHRCRFQGCQAVQRV